MKKVNFLESQPAEKPFPNWTKRFYERRIPKRLGISKAICIVNGDGWKDTAKIGDVSFVYGREMRAPYAAGLFMKVGNPIAASSVASSQFEKPNWRELFGLVKDIVSDIRYQRKRLSLMFGPVVVPDPAHPIGLGKAFYGKR